MTAHNTKARCLSLLWFHRARLRATVLLVYRKTVVWRQCRGVRKLRGMLSLRPCYFVWMAGRAIGRAEVAVGRVYLFCFCLAPSRRGAAGSEYRDLPCDRPVWFCLFSCRHLCLFLCPEDAVELGRGGEIVMELGLAGPAAQKRPGPTLSLGLP